MIAPIDNKDSKRYSTAIHEAAHAAVVYQYRGRINSVSIVPDADTETAGRAVFNSAVNMPPVGRIAIAFAGGIGVWQLLNRTGPMVQEGRCDFDIEQAMETVKKLHGQQYGEQHAELIREGLRSAQKTVERLWPAIGVVADYLLANSEMSGLLAAAIFRTQDKLERD